MIWSETSAIVDLLLLSVFIPSVLSKPVSEPAVPRSNPLGIDWSPAPSPEDGPPLSANASRNKALLPAQIGGIVGAYLLSLCIVGIVLLCLARNLRKRIEQEAKLLEVELVETNFQGVYTGSTGPTPITPSGLRNYSWPSPDRKQAQYEFSAPVNPDPRAFVFPSKPETEAAPYVYPTHGSIYSHQSNLSIDNKVLEADREMMSRDLEDIYAHVMEQDEAKAAGVDVKSMPPPKIPGAQTQPPAQQQKAAKHKPSIISVSSEKSTKSQSRASSILSSLTSPKLPKSPKSKGIRGLKISSPMGTPVNTTFQPSDEEPLTPRSYTPRAPPPVPRNQVPYVPSSRHASHDSESPVGSIAETLATITPTSPPVSPRNESRFPLPALTTRNLHLSLRSDKSNSASPRSPGGEASRSPLPQAVQPKPSKSSFRKPKLSLAESNMSQSPTAVSSTNRSLPFRQYEPSITSPTFATSTKTTVLERVAPANGPRTGGLKTPFTGGAVPYSPYQPFTPMMPVTPSLVTKEDRKRMKRAVPKTPTMEMIKSDEEIWG